MDTQTPDTRLIRNIRQITDGLEKYGNHFLRDKDLTFSQGSLALFLEEYPEDSIALKDLEKFLHLSQPTVFGLARRLEKRGLIESFFTPEDGRLKKIRLTPAGVKSVQVFKECVNAIESHLLHSLNEEERQVFVSLLIRVNQGLKDSASEQD